jgi:hypothetical protein
MNWSNHAYSPQSKFNTGGRMSPARRSHASFHQLSGRFVHRNAARSDLRNCHARGPLHRWGKVHANGITIAYESYGRTDREAILLIGGTAMQLIIDDAIAENAARAHDSRAD